MLASLLAAPVNLINYQPHDANDQSGAENKPIWSKRVHYSVLRSVTIPSARGDRRHAATSTPTTSGNFPSLLRYSNRATAPLRKSAIAASFISPCPIIVCSPMTATAVQLPSAARSIVALSIIVPTSPSSPKDQNSCPVYQLQRIDSGSFLPIRNGLVQISLLKELQHRSVF